MLDMPTMAPREPVASGLLREHPSQRRAHGQHLAAGVERQCLVPARRGQLVDRRVAEPPSGAPGDREQAIDAAERVRGRCHGGLCLGVVGQVGRGPAGLGPGRRELVGEHAQVVLRARDEEQPCPFGREPVGGRGGDARGARDDHAAPGEAPAHEPGTNSSSTVP